MRHVPSIAEHRVVEHRVKANYGSRDGGEGKKPSGEVVGGGQKCKRERAYPGGTDLSGSEGSIATRLVF